MNAVCAPRATVISASDAAKLSWYFCEGVAAFERSQFGSSLERAENFYVPHSSVIPTARPTCETRPVGGYMPDSGLLARYGKISKRLSRVSATDPNATATLGIYYGDQGAAWQRYSRGAIVSLFLATHSGQEIVKRSKAQSPTLDLNARQRLAVVVHQADIRPTDSTRKLIERATQEARTLLSHAHEVWNACCA